MSDPGGRLGGHFPAAACRRNLSDASQLCCDVVHEIWSFACRHKNKRLVWLAQCRRTRQIVAYASGNRNEATCRVLWSRIPKRYKKCVCYTDFWAAYA